jgi:hypothetical protein
MVCQSATDENKSSNQCCAVSDPHRNAVRIAIPPKIAGYFRAAAMLANEILPVALVAIDCITSIRRGDGYECEEIYHCHDEQYSKRNWPLSPLDSLSDVAAVHWSPNEKEISHGRMPLQTR